MTPEERLTKLEEAMLVNASLLTRLDQQGEGHKDWLEAHNAAIRKHDEEIGDLRSALLLLNSALDKTHAAVEKTHEEMRIMKSSMDGLFERWDRFLRGQEGNGRKGRE